MEQELAKGISKFDVAIEKNLCIVSVPTLIEFEKADSPYAVYALYMFYYKCAKLQRTNQPKVTENFISKQLKIPRQKLRDAKKFLIENNLITDIVYKDSKGRLLGWFIKLNYVWKSDSLTTAGGRMGCPDDRNLTTAGGRALKVTKVELKVTKLKSSCNSKERKVSQTPRQDYTKIVSSFFLNPDSLWTDSLVSAFPGTDINAEFRKMQAWLISNPPKKNLKRFAVNWLGRKNMFRKEGARNGGYSESSKFNTESKYSQLPVKEM